MRRVISALVAGLLVTSCSSKSPEEKATEEAIQTFQELFGTVDPSSVVEVDEATAKSWPKKFCELVIDMTREEVQAVMGTPTLTFRDQTANQDQYEAWGYSLTVFYDTDDRAEIIQTNKDNVPCETKFRS